MIRHRLVLAAIIGMVDAPVSADVVSVKTTILLQGFDLKNEQGTGFVTWHDDGTCRVLVPKHLFCLHNSDNSVIGCAPNARDHEIKSPKKVTVARSETDETSTFPVVILKPEDDDICPKRARQPVKDDTTDLLERFDQGFLKTIGSDGKRENVRVEIIRFDEKEIFFRALPGFSVRLGMSGSPLVLGPSGMTVALQDRKIIRPNSDELLVASRIEYLLHRLDAKLGLDRNRVSVQRLTDVEFVLKANNELELEDTGASLTFEGWEEEKTLESARYAYLVLRDYTTGKIDIDRRPCYFARPCDLVMTARTFRINSMNPDGTKLVVRITERESAP